MEIQKNNKEYKSSPDQGLQNNDCCGVNKNFVQKSKDFVVENPWRAVSILFAAIFISILLLDVDVSIDPRFVKAGDNNQKIVSLDSNNKTQSIDTSNEELVLPPGGVELPVKWGGLGKQLIDSGVIDGAKFVALYENRGGFSKYEADLLYGEDVENIKIDAENAGFLLNLLWAFGLGQKSSILDNGPMQDERYGGADKFASTGGWTLAKGNTMDHYSKHSFVALTKEQEELVKKVSSGIYRPCCGNSTFFPDCNHGMAMLGLLELMASQGLSEQIMYDVALVVNSYWFPDTYLTIAKYKAKEGKTWDQVDSREVLGANFSSGAGYSQIKSKVAPVANSGGGSCGV